MDFSQTRSRFEVIKTDTIFISTYLMNHHMFSKTHPLDEKRSKWTRLDIQSHQCYLLLNKYTSWLKHTNGQYIVCSHWKPGRTVLASFPGLPGNEAREDQEQDYSVTPEKWRGRDGLAWVTNVHGLVKIGTNSSIFKFGHSNLLLIYSDKPAVPTGHLQLEGSVVLVNSLHFQLCS